MLPLKDDVTTAGPALVTVALISLTVMACLYQLTLSLGDVIDGATPAREFVLEFGATPCRLTGGCTVPREFPPAGLTVLTSLFVHAGLLHAGGNMLYLWIFGRGVEHRLGHWRFLLFYLLAGLAAVWAQVISDPVSPVPIVGASGAVSGILGAYLLLFPRATVLTLVTFGFYWRLVHLPAGVVLGLWVVVQAVTGYVSHGLAGGLRDAGVAWFAHLGGFVAGMLLMFALRPRRRRPVYPRWR